MNNYFKAVIAVVPFTILYFGLVFYFEAEKNSGKEFVLQVVSRDPNDFLRGEYVNLQYSINRIEDVPHLEAYTNGTYCVELSTTVPVKSLEVSVKGQSDRENLICGDGFVVNSFEKDSQFLINIDGTRYVFSQSIDNESVMLEIKNQVGEYYYNVERRASIKENIEKYLAQGLIEIEKGRKDVNITYGNIQKYFLPRGTGWYIDKMARENRLQAVISLGSSGRAYIKYLQVDGNRVDYNSIPEQN